jgi:glycosyltransferase involved in cell wall biosynthesis
MLAYDARWIGTHGIGRFASEIAIRLPIDLHFSKRGNPAKIFSSSELGAWVRKSCANCLYSPGYIPPSGTSIPFVFTIHDLNHIDVPYNSSMLKRFYYQHVIFPGIHMAHRIVTVSEYSKKRILDWSGCVPEKVVVACNGVSDAFKEQGNRALPGYPYLFCCSNRKEHKNEARLLYAFKLSGLHKQLKLVFTGFADKASSEKVIEHGLSDCVVYIGKIEESDLASWYRGAIATVFPSLYEGFGLPVIESMACGTPVVTSCTTSLPEVGGDAALYVDPISLESIAHGIVTVIDDSALREDMKKRGLLRAAEFTWERAARSVGEAIAGLLD